MAVRFDIAPALQAAIRLRATAPGSFAWLG